MRLSLKTFFVCILFAAGACHAGFVPGTLIKLSEHDIPIEEVQIGDQVYCYDLSGACLIRKITAVSCHNAPCLICLRLENDVVSCAPDQLFYLGNAIGWRKAQGLQVGDQIVNIAGGYSLIQEIETLGETRLVYDITVEDCHNFYVSESGILAHNMVVVLAAPVAPVITSAVVFTAIEAATTVSFIAGCIYSFCWGSSSKKSTLSSNSSGGGNNNGCICGCGPCGIGCNCGCMSCGCGNKDSEWKKNKISKQEFFKNALIKKNYEHVRDGIYQLKKGGVPIVKGANYLQWDHLHGDVEVYRTPKAHIGSLDPNTLKLYKDPVGERKLSL